MSNDREASFALSRGGQGRALPLHSGGRGRALHLRLLLASVCLLSPFACTVDHQRSGLPAGAQAVIDELTEEIAAGEFTQVYANAADEWRASVSAEESEKILARVRDRLGRVQSRVPLRATDQPGGAAGHTLSVSYNTKFERADAIESVTLVERDGRWQLARYAVNSDALKP
ncbi:MAG TPA: DUF4019 domain-containing protein [Pyrinomonadaceae bacterium]|jgi:hypothetical protein|nr:DUF4019 domain-containing protein [Pyrinomonadaceae bacterium]